MKLINKHSYIQTFFFLDCPGKHSPGQAASSSQGLRNLLPGCGISILIEEKWGGVGLVGCVWGGIGGSHRHAGPLHGSSSLGSWWGVMAVHLSSQTAPLQWKQLLESRRCRRSHTPVRGNNRLSRPDSLIPGTGIIIGTWPVGFSNSNFSVLLFRFSGICYCR